MARKVPSDARTEKNVRRRLLGFLPNRCRRRVPPATRYDRRLAALVSAHLAARDCTEYATSRAHAIMPYPAKLTDIAGLNVEFPAHAVVFSLDEKSQIEALDRTSEGGGSI
jgi:hypothetical protein